MVKKKIMQFVLIIGLPVWAWSMGGITHAENYPSDGFKLQPSVKEQIQKTAQADVLVVLDDNDAKAAAARMRKSLGLPHDNATILSERRRLFRQKKDTVLSRVSAKNYQLLRDYDNFPVMHMRIDEEALAKLSGMAEITHIGEDIAVRPQLAQSLPLIGAPQPGATGTGTYVAVVDTGVNYSLSDFGSCSAPGSPASCKVAFEQCFATGGCQTNKDHGTNVSGIVVGVAPDTKILALDVFRTDGYAFYSDIIAALNWLMTNKSSYPTVVAVNMSLGGDASSAPCSDDGLAVAISTMKASGITTAVASGNSGYTDAISRPACAPDAISVGAVYDSNISGTFNWGICQDINPLADQVTCFSNSSSFLTMLAPGSVITAAGISMSGTSQATPHVAGTVAALKSHDATLTPDQVKARLLATGVPVLDTRNSITKPRVDLYNAVTVATPLILAIPDNFSLMAAQGGVNPADQTFSITNGGVGTLSWTISSSDSWLTLDPLSGTDAGNVTLSVNTTGLAAGMHSASATISAPGALNTPRVLPVALQIVDSAFSEDFETGNFVKFPWATGGAATWSAQSLVKHTGTYAAQSPSMGNSQTSYLEVALNVTSPGYAYFWLKTSTEPTFDHLVFRVDGINEGPLEGWSGTTDWTFTHSEHIVSTGIHIFRWEYSKDPSVSQGSDAVWLDDIFFPPSNLQVPRVSASPASQNFGSQPVGGTSAAQTFTISNAGTGSLILGSLSITGTSGSDFTKQNDNCSGQTLAPSATCTVDAKFAPASPGSKSASLSIPSNYPQIFNVPLTGTATTQYLLTVNRNGTGTGTVTSNIAGITCGVDCTEPYNQSTVVILTAAADPGFTFTGWSGGGCSGTGTCTVTMPASPVTVTATFTALAPAADFTASPLSGPAPLSVNFTDLSLHGPTAWSWSFGDSGISTLQNPAHTYQDAGTYPVTLTASNATGSGLATKPNYITVSCPVLPARIPGAPPAYYSSLQAAYNAASDGAVIQAQGVDVIGDLNVNRNVSVTLKGGYDPCFTTNLLKTTIHGAMTISNGTAIVENLVIL